MDLQIAVQNQDQDMNQPDAVFVTPPTLLNNRARVQTQLPDFLDARQYDQETFVALQDFSCNIAALPLMGNSAVLIVETALPQFEILPSIRALLNNQGMHTQWQYRQGGPIPRIIDNGAYAEESNDITMFCTPIYVLGGQHVVLGRAVIKNDQLTHYQVFDTGNQTEQYRQYVETFMIGIVSRKTSFQVDPQVHRLEFRRLESEDTCEECVAILYSYFILHHYEKAMNPRNIPLAKYNPLYHNVNKFYVQNHYSFEQIVFRCVQLSQANNYITQIPSDRPSNPLLIWVFKLLFIRDTSDTFFDQYLNELPLIDPNADRTVSESTPQLPYYEELGSEPDVDMNELMDDQPQQQFIVPAQTRFNVADGPSAIASGICAQLERQQARLASREMQGQHIYWNLSLGFTRVNRDVARRYIIGFNANNIANTPLGTVFTALVQFLSELHQSFTDQYSEEAEMQDRDNVRFNIRVEDYQFGTREEINALKARSKYANADQIKKLSVLISRIGRERGNRAYAFYTKLNAIASKLACAKNTEFDALLHSSQGIVDHHTMQSLQIESFHLIEQLDQVEGTNFMKKPCLEQTFLAVVLDISSKTKLLSEEDRAFVHQTIANRTHLFAGDNTHRIHRLVDIIVNLCVYKDYGFCKPDELQKLQIQSKSGCVNQFILQLNKCLDRHNQRCQPKRRFQVKLLTAAQLYKLIQIQPNKNRRRRHGEQIDEAATSSKIIEYLKVDRCHADDLYIFVKFRMHVYIYDLQQLISACKHILAQDANLYKRPCMELTPSPSLHTFNIEGIRRRYEQYPDSFKLELKDLILQLLEETSVACNVFDYFTRFDYKTHLYKETQVNNLMSLPTSKLDQLFEQAAYTQDRDNESVEPQCLFSQHIFKTYQSVDHMSVRSISGRVYLKDLITEQRKIYFSTIAMLAIDIETLTIDNNDGQGNQFPYVICVFGTYRSLDDKYSLKLKKAVHTFRGVSCIKQFISWLQTEGIILDPNNDTHNRNLAAHSYLNGNWVPFNTIVAHNGCKFDFKFILDELSNVTKVNTLGTSLDFKQLRTPELLFTDSFLLVGQSLAKFTSTFSSNVAERFSQIPTSDHQKLVHELYGCVDQNVKGSNTDIIGLTYQIYCQWEKTNDKRLQSIHKYCLLDCSSLFFAFYVYLETVYTSSVNRPVYIEDYTGITHVFNQNVIHVTAPSMTMQHYKLMQETVLRPNINALPIEQLSYTGGLTMANISRGRIGVSIDINSSYPTAMMNKQPAKHYPADSNKHRFDSKYISNDILVEYAHMQTIRQINQTIDVSKGIHATLISAGQSFNIESYCLYEITFKVNRTKCSMSAFQCMSMQREMLIEPSQFIPHTEVNSKTKQIEGTWQWGINILYMLKEGFLENLHISRMIRYEGVDLFGKFITGLYNKRLEAKAENDEVRSHICKQLMNYLYGKFGQKTLSTVHRGEPEELYDIVVEYNQLNQQQQIVPHTRKFSIETQQVEDEGIHMEAHLLAHRQKVSYYNIQQTFKFISTNKKLSLKEVEGELDPNQLQPANEYKIKRHCHQLVVQPDMIRQLHSVGSLTRVASLITSYGKLQLVQAYNKLMSLNQKGKPDIKVCYGDTDSLHLCMQDRIEWEVNQSQDTDIKDRFRFICSLQDKFESNQTMSQGELSYGAECLTKVVLWSNIYKEIIQLQVYDATKFDQFVPVNMVDSLRLGGLKVEHLSAAQSFSAPKQYSQLQVDPIPNTVDKFTDVLGFSVKGKGVNKKALQQQPLAWVQQEKTYTHTVMHLTKYLLSIPAVYQFLQATNYIYFNDQLAKTDNPLHRQMIRQFLDELDEPSSDYSYLVGRTLKQICFHFRNILTKELDLYSANENVNQQLVEAAQSIACIFINAGSFQTTGNSVCIRSVMKTIMPSFRKRDFDLDNTERDGHFVTKPYDTLFHFELMQNIQSTILRHIRKLLVSTPQFKRKIVEFAQRQDTTSFSSQIRLHLYTNSLAEQSVKQMMGMFSTETQRQIAQQLILKRIDKTVFDPLQPNRQQARRVNMIQLGYEITNLYRLMFITNSSILSSILTIISQHLTVRTQMIVTSQPGQIKSNINDIELDIAFFLMVYCDIFNVTQEHVERFKELFLDITKKYDNEKQFKQKIIENHIQRKKGDQYRDLLQLASEVCSHSLLHRNHMNELVLCNTRFLIFTLFKKHKDLRIDTDPLYDTLLQISTQSKTTPYQQTIHQAQQVIQSNVYHFIKQLKQDNLTIYDCFDPKVDMNMMDESDMQAEQAVCVNEPLLTIEEQEAQDRYTTRMQEAVYHHNRTLEREQSLFDYQGIINKKDEDQSMAFLNEVLDLLDPPVYVNVIRNAQDSDDQSD